MFGARYFVDEQYTLPFGERAEHVHVLAVVGMSRVGEEGQQSENNDGEDFLNEAHQLLHTSKVAKHVERTLSLEAG